jgi:uncharacterized protein (DUF488 family)
MDQARELLTIGHSTHPIGRFLELLRTHDVELVADVRRYPGSRRNPQFGEEALAASLEGAGIAYEWFGEVLGGRRSVVAGSPNSGWRVEAFQGYADHMISDEFAGGVERLEALAGMHRTVVMCAEAHPSRCHRRLLADAMTLRGWRVRHVLADGAVEAHELTPFARIDGDFLTYPPAQGRLV